MNPILSRLSLLALCFCAGCTGPAQSKRHLSFESNTPLNLAVGDTSVDLLVSKTDVDAQGRESTTSDYIYFHLVSKDTSIAVIVDRTKVLGKSAGQTSVTAVDDQPSGLVSDNALSIVVK